MHSPGLPNPQFVDVKRLDHLPLIGAMLWELAMQETLDALVPPYKRNAVTVGECVEALVLMILTGEHALSRVADTLAGYDPEVISHAQWMRCIFMTTAWAGRLMPCGRPVWTASTGR